VTLTQVLGFPAGESFSPTRWTPAMNNGPAVEVTRARWTHQDEAADSRPLSWRRPHRAA
jgi:hypothetical protein